MVVKKTGVLSKLTFTLIKHYQKSLQFNNKAALTSQNRNLWTDWTILYWLARIKKKKKKMTGLYRNDRLP